MDEAPAVAPNNPQNTSTIIVVVGLLVFFGLLWIGFNRRQQPPGQVSPTPTAAAFSGPVKIGWMGPLTGDAASYGTSIKRGVELAHKELGLKNVTLVFEDTKCEAKDAVSGITKLVGTDKVLAIIGEVCAGATLAAAPIAEQNHVVLISAASTSPKITDAGGSIFRTVPSDELQGDFGANIVIKRGLKKLAVLHSNEEYGLGFANVLKDRFPKLGGEVVASEAFELTAVDLRTQLTKIKAASPDAIYIISNSLDSAVAALKQIKELGITARIFGSEGLKSPDIVKGAKSTAEGLLVTSVSVGTSDFIARHKAAYNGEEPGPFAVQGYDAYTVLAKAIQQGVGNREALTVAVPNITFEGASGKIKFDANGDVAGNYDVYVVKDGKFTLEQ